MKPYSYKLNLIAAALVSTCSTLVQAQDAVLPEVRVVDEQSDSAYAATVTRTATKTETELKDVPQAVTVVTRQLINDQGMQSIGDVVRYVPGVGIAQGEGHRDAPIFRGNTSTSDLFVDGQRDDVQYYRDLYNIDRVEVLKGANAMIFGRGGVGGVINRVTRQADWNRTREVTLGLGSWDHRRVAVDLGDGLNDNVATRVTGVYEDSESYRDYADVRRYGINPTLALKADKNTKVTLGYEYFYDERTTDRGVPSLNGRPFDTNHSVFFGNPDESQANVEVNALSFVLDHAYSDNLNLRNSLRMADYAKHYANVFANGAVNTATGNVSLAGYFSNTDRQNLINQTDLTWNVQTGAIRHVLLGGVELSRQMTENLRMTSRFDTDGDGIADSNNLIVSASNPTTFQPVAAFIAGTNDANNDVDLRGMAVYIQDQMTLLPQLDAILGLRYDHVRINFTDRKASAAANPLIETKDDLVSPRAGLVYRPVQAVSLYTSYSLSYLPRAGEQLSSLNPANRTTDPAFKPEQFTNYEVGAKWDVRPGLALTLAVYELQRSNVAVADPANPGNTILVDGQKSKGVELGWNGNLTRHWSLAGGYAYQDAELTAGPMSGKALGQTPQHSWSLWNRYDFTRMWGAGVGLYSRSDMFVNTGNTVILDGYTRVDAAVFFNPMPRLSAQINIENLTDEDYYVNAHSDNNIMPGSPVAVKLGVTARF